MNQVRSFKFIFGRYFLQEDRIVSFLNQVRDFVWDVDNNFKMILERSWFCLRSSFCNQSGWNEISLIKFVWLLHLHSGYQNEWRKFEPQAEHNLDSIYEETSLPITLFSPLRTNCILVLIFSLSSSFEKEFLPLPLALESDFQCLIESGWLIDLWTKIPAEWYSL